MSETQAQGGEVQEILTEVPDGAQGLPPVADEGDGHPAGSTDRLKAIVANRRKAKANGSAATPDATVSATNSEEPATTDSAAPESDGNGLSERANDELAKLAARRGETTSVAEASVPNVDGDVDKVNVADALKTEADTRPDTGGKKWKSVKDRIKDGEVPGQESKSKSAAQKAKEKARAAAAKQKEKEAEAKKREKEKSREKTEKQKAAEAKRKESEKDKQAARKKAEEERKARLAEAKKQRAAERAAKQTPDLMRKEPKAVQEAFAQDYALAGPKTDRNPEGIGLRRAKADRGDFCAGYIMALRRVRKEQRATAV